MRRDLRCVTLPLLGQFIYVTPRSLMAVRDQENIDGDRRFEYRDCIITMIEYSLLSNPTKIPSHDEHRIFTWELSRLLRLP